MKRFLYVLVASTLSLMIATCAGAQSLGDLARQQRETKKPAAAKVYTNDDFAAATLTTPEPPATGKAEKTTADAAQAPKTDEKVKAAAALKTKIDEQQKVVTQLERELDVAQREYRLKVAVYYADAGNSLRDGKKWAEEDRKQKAEVETKQKAIAEAKQKLTALQDQARKSGAPNQ